MKKYGILAVAVLAVGMACAGSLDKIAGKVATVETSETNASVTFGPFRGWLERIDLTYANSTSTVYVAIAASNAYTGVNRTLLTLDTVATNASYMPRDSTQDTLGVNVVTNAIRFTLLDEMVTISATGALFEGQSVLGTVIYERP